MNMLTVVGAVGGFGAGEQPRPIPGVVPTINGDTEILSETLKVQTKIFYVDLKRNNRGMYMKISEKGRFRSKSSIVVPVQGMGSFFQLFDYYYEECNAGRLGQPRDMVVEGKVFSFNAGENERGRFLRIFESGGGRYPAGGSSLMIPCGWGNANMKIFKDCFAKLKQFLVQEGISTGEPSAALSAPRPGSEEATVELSSDGAPVLSVGNKHFFFDLRTNDRGTYLKIKEVAGNMKNLLVIPVPAIPKFQEAIALAMMSRPLPDQR